MIKILDGELRFPNLSRLMTIDNSSVQCWL